MSDETFFGMDHWSFNFILGILTIFMIGLLFGPKESKPKPKMEAGKEGNSNDTAATATENKVEQPKLTLKQLKAQLRREQRERAEKRAKQLERESPKKAGLL